MRREPSTITVGFVTLGVVMALGCGKDDQPAIDAGAADGNATSNATTCQEKCTADVDCQIGGIPPEYLACIGERCLLVQFFDDGRLCDADIDCHHFFSSPGAKECASDTDCDSPGVLVCTGGHTNGKGYCQILASVFECDANGRVSEALPHLGDTGTVEVCLDRKYACAEHFCEPTCSIDADCAGNTNDTVCNTVTHRCECSATSCVIDGSVCVAGKCECTKDEDCNSPSTNTCYDGVCGCGDTTACTEMVYPGTTKVCEPPKSPPF